MKQKNSLLRNIVSDMPNGMKIVLSIAAIAAVFLIIAKYAPFAKPLEQKLLEDCMYPEFPFTMFLIHIVMAMLYFIGILGICLLGCASYYLLFSVVAFFVIEYKISRLPDDYFTKHNETTPEELCSLLNVFQFKGHCLSKRPRFLEDNLKHIQYLMKSFTEAQANLVRHSKGGGYLDFHYKYDEEDGWIFAY